MVQDKGSNLFDPLFEGCHEAVFVIDTGSKRIELCNAVAERMFGHPAGELIGQSIRILHLNGGEFERISTEMENQLARTKLFETYGFMCRRNGEEFPCHQRAVMIQSGAEARKALYLVEEETEAAELSDEGTSSQDTAATLESVHSRRFRRLFHVHPLPLWVCDRSFLRIRAANNAALSLSGHSSTDIQGTAYPELLDIQSRDDLSQRLAMVDRPPGAVDTVSLKTKSGELIPLRLQAFATSWDNLDCIACLGVPLRGVERVFGTTRLDQDEITRRLDSLSRREHDVLKRVVYGETNKEIALSLAISPRTVEVYRASMLRKMGVRSTAHLLSILIFDAMDRR